MTGVLVEITGKAAVQQTAKGSGSSCLEIVGKAAVEGNDGTSVEVIGKAAVLQRTTGSVEIMGKASVQDSKMKYARAHMIHFSWSSACLTCMGITFWSVILFVRFVYLWQQCLLTGGASSWSVMRASVVLGMEIGLFVMMVLLVLLVPRMIVTWTTTVVFKYLLGVVVSGGKGGGKHVIRDGTKVAKEISWITLASVFEEGNAVAAGVLLVCFATTAILRQLLAIG